jgi:uncharacterized membrane protein
MFTKKHFIELAAVLLFGLFVRLYGLSAESLWFDEAFTIKFARLDLFEIFSRCENNPPLYNMIMHGWIHFFGVSEFSIRLPSVVFGVLALFVMYKTGCRLFNKNVGLLSSLLLGISVFHIWYSQEARNYSLAVLATLLSMYYFLKLLKSGHPKTLLGYIFFSFLLMYSHIYGLFIIFSQNMYLGCIFLFSGQTIRISLKKWVLSQLGLLILFSPWVAIFINRLLFVQTGDWWLTEPNIHSVFGSFLIYSNNNRFVLYLFLAAASFSIISLKTVREEKEQGYFLKLIAICPTKYRLENIQKICFLFFWLLTPVVVPFLISLFVTPLYHTRYTIVAVPAFYLLVCKGVDTIKGKPFKLLLICIITAFSLHTLWQYNTKINKAQWREVVGYIDANALESDFLLFRPFVCKEILFNYYSQRDDLVGKDAFIKKGFSKTGFSEKEKSIDLLIDRLDDQYLEELGEALQGYKRVWVIIPFMGGVEGPLEEKLSESFKESFHRRYIGVDLYLFERRSD